MTSGEHEVEGAHEDAVTEGPPHAPRARGRGTAAVVAAKFGWLALAVAVVALPLAGRVAWEGRAELDAAEQARVAGDADAEIEHLGRAARWRAPGLSHDETALDRLEAVAERAQDAGGEEDHIALSAHREVRRALLATRSFGVPHPQRFARANVAIAALMAKQEAAFGTDASGGAAAGELERFHLDLLTRIPGPDPWRANLAALAFVAWLGASAGFVLRGLDGQGRLRARPALRWGASSLVMLVVWAVLLATVR